MITKQQRIADFEKRHGADSEPYDGWLLYADGALREPQCDALVEPPPHDYGALGAEARFHELRAMRFEALAAAAQRMSRSHAKYANEMRRLQGRGRG